MEGWERRAECKEGLECSAEGRQNKETVAMQRLYRTRIEVNVARDIAHQRRLPVQCVAVGDSPLCCKQRPQRR